MEHFPIETPELPPLRESLNAHIAAIRHHQEAAETHRTIKKEIAVMLMMRSELPVTAISEALGVSRPTLYAWRDKLAPPSPDEPEAS